MADHEIPRDLQSDLHDKIDSLGERAARGELVEVVTGVPFLPGVGKAEICTCVRYSQRDPDDPQYVAFWYKEDPNCEYIHPAPFPSHHRIKLAP